MESEEDSFLALNDVSFDVKEGEILGIIGKKTFFCRKYC